MVYEMAVNSKSGGELVEFVLLDERQLICDI